MDIQLNTKEEVLAFIREDQDSELAAHIDIAVMNGQYQLYFNTEDQVWNLRGDYHTLAVISEADGVEVNDLLLTRVYG